MRITCLLLLLAACTSSVPAAPPAEPATAALVAAVEAWRASPDAAHLDAVGLAAAEAQAVPPGDHTLDRALGDALANALMRPDLAIPRLEPLAPTLGPAEAHPWLDALLRAGDLPRFAAEIERIHAYPIDPTQEGLVAAAAQARVHREVDWRAAVRAHDASSLAAHQVMVDRERLDRPVESLPDALDALAALLPGWRIAMVTTRSVNPTEPPASDTPGAIPANAGRRRVLGYADGLDPAGPRRLAEALVTRRPTRVAGLVIGAEHPDGRALVLCAEGRFDEGRLWLNSGCGPERESAWLDAAALWADLGDADPRSRAAAIRDRYGARLEAGQ